MNRIPKAWIDRVHEIDPTWDLEFDEFAGYAVWQDNQLPVIASDRLIFGPTVLPRPFAYIEKELLRIKERENERAAARADREKRA